LSPSGFEEDFLILAQRLLELYGRVREEAARLPAIRESTRRELYRRLLRGRDYLHAHSSGAVPLSAVARAACLSPFHFHRGFTQAFRRTPHEYLTGLRLTQARRMIETGSALLEALHRRGILEPIRVHRLFRVYFGQVPSQIRRKRVRSGKNPARSIQFYRETLDLPIVGTRSIVGATEIVFPVQSVAAAHSQLAARGSPLRGGTL
jgi:AraC-like DNA-binding protein